MRSTLILLALASLPLATFAAAQAGDLRVPLPDLTHNDHWTYETTLAGGASGAADVVGPADVSVAVEQVQMAGVTTDAYRVTWTYTGDRSGETSTAWYRTSDFAKLQASSGMGGSDTVYTLAEPCAEWRFPMAVGDTWSTSCAFAGGGDAFTIPSEWEVVRAEKVTVPAGTFDALVLEQRGETFTETWWFARETCLYAKHESRGADGAVVSSATLVSFACTPAAPSTPPSPTGGSPASSTPVATSPAASPPVGSTSPAPGTTTPAGTPTPAGATPAGNASGEGGATPGAPLMALLGALAAGALVMRRKVR